MFPTFSGNSRRPRNVNLSGQKSDPFAGSGWNPPATTGSASKSVAEAQADRQKRQQERERLKAAQQIQRTWRGHRERQGLRRARRETFDALYARGPIADTAERLTEALRLLLGFFGTPTREDCGRLELVIRDLEQTQYSVISSGRIRPEKLRRLVRILAATLRKDALDPQIAFVALVRIVEIHPSLVSDELDTYYNLVAKICIEKPAKDPTSTELLHRAMVLPLRAEVDPFATKAYRSFVLTFLTLPEVSFLEENAGLVARSISSEQLSSAVLDVYASGAVTDISKERLLWLLAHFLGLQRTTPAASRSSSYAKALYLQLSSLANDIRVHFPTQMPSKEASRGSGGLPEYVATQLASLVGRGEIAGALDKFTINYAGTTAGAAEDASILAGYILTLIRCFPKHSDEIRMRLYLADIGGPSGKVPSTKFFYRAASSTKAFQRIVSDEKATLNFLLQRTYFQPTSSITKDSEWDREWRTVLMFLELYVFVLRLTDDEDFLGGFAEVEEANTKPQSRVTACSLALEDVKRVSLFLKHLGFTLYHNAAELLPGEGAATDKREEVSMEDIITMANLGGKGKGKGKAKARAKEPPTFSVISGIDFGAFRSIVTTAMRMLYERDSRRQFLPKDHWLMTTRFADLDGFLSAVVLEEQRSHELQQGEDEDSDDDEDEDEEMPDVDRRAYTSAGLRRSQLARREQYRARHKKQTRERTLALVGPKLAVLRNMPFVIPFETRVKIFRQFVYLDKHRRRNGHVDPDLWRQFVLSDGGTRDPESMRGAVGRHHAKIRRGNLFVDAYEQFYELGEGLKEPIQITFVDQFDTVEAGIDGGGVTKEFLTSVTTEAFADSQHNLFVTTPSAALYPNPLSLDQLQASMRRAGLREGDLDWNEQMQSVLEQYEFLGRIVGKCMYESILINVVFAGFFLLKWASSASASDSGYRASINDLREMDEELHQGLLQLKNFQGDVSQLGLDFTITDQVSRPGEPTVTVTRNLMPNGADTPVTNENRPLYISYVARHRLVSQPFHQTKAFLRGLGSIVDPAWLSMFNQTELQRLVGGDSSEIDVEDLRRNTVYSGVYEIGDDGKEHPTVELFWQAMHEFPDTQRRAVLKYVTSTPRAPLLGFSLLSPKFSIRDGGSDPERLPSASTCINLLKLPRYPTLEVMKSKLEYAISSNAGFDLS